MDRAAPTPQAISGISDTKSIRVLLLANGQQIHVPLNGLLKPLTDRISELEARLDAAGIPEVTHG
ncbi:hypothetical protein [Pseudochrobactrum kiredjianiae]|uniref:Uncharacterized protein n=1 Tax=Pseudochrobactrum kiredjianiae TaxID=386305 RepID=A0ABW3V1M1_9HYPH|nr:hypothetical protein [Pseudochrobactrum kiredjianiae]MDM7852373.1 hypothetical protein [Pseudochrobactrum kiredjianiae]